MRQNNYNSCRNWRSRKNKISYDKRLKIEEEKRNMKYTIETIENGAIETLEVDGTIYKKE